MNINSKITLLKLLLIALLFVQIPQVFAETDNISIVFNLGGLTDFDYIKWLNYYTGHFWFLLHIFLLVYVIVNFFMSYTRGLWKRVTRDKKTFITEIYIQRITRRYNLFAEIFLLIGLAGAALSVQSAITPDFFKITTDFEQNIEAVPENNLRNETQKHEDMAEAIKKGLAFSAAGIILAILCYILKNIELRPYHSILLREKQQEKTEFRNSFQNISKIYLLFRQFLSKQPPQNSNIITLATVLDALDESSNENIRRVILAIQKSQSTFNQQLEDIKQLQSDFSKSSKSIQTFSANIQAVNDDLKASQIAFKQDLLQQMDTFVRSHANYLEHNTVNTQAILRKNLEETNEALIAIWEKEIEQVYQTLQENLTQEHALYIERLEKYQSLIGVLELKVDEHLHQALAALQEENGQIHAQVLEAVEKLKAVIISDFLHEIGKHSNNLAQAFNAYVAKTSSVTEINRINMELVKDTMEEAGFTPKESILKRLLSKLKE